MLKHIACAAALVVAGFVQAQPAPMITQEMLLPYLDQLTNWQRSAATLEPTAINAREIVFRDSLRENAGRALQSGFIFIRSVAESQPKTETLDPESTRQRLTKQAEDIRGRLAGGVGGDERRLLQARLELIGTILANLNSASNKSPNKLTYTLDSLERSIPELGGNEAATEATTEPAAAPKRVAGSILGLGANWFEIARKQRELDDAIIATTALKKQSMELMKTLRSGLGEPAAAAEKEEEEEEEKPAVIPLTVDERVDAYREIGKNIVPLAESMRWMDASKQTLKEWNEVLEQRGETVLKQLGVRIGIMVLTLAIVFMISEAVRRSLKRVKDPKRKRQLNTVRRVVVGVAVVFIIVLNFISDFSSFATFAGFLTAGLAVALQSVLLSLCAHFLFYGRYGIRNGDRVHVAGVTGDILSIGMVRFYMRELEEDESGELKPTGKTVAFPNSIVFQTVAFYKYA